jgi:hypothetical protein
VKDKLARGLSVSKKEKGVLGYILQRLAGNLQFPPRGRAVYDVETKLARSREPRLLRCEYVFDGVQYAFSVVETSPGDFNVQTYFDGENAIRYMALSKVATVWEGKRQSNPVYNLRQYYPGEIIEDLLDHTVELKGSHTINEIACSVLESVMSSKDRLKVWVTKEPDAYPLRIERYENDTLRYVYEAENVKFWNGFLLPEKTTISWYRSDDSLQHSLISSYVVNIESFTPNVEIAANEFAPDFPPGITVSKHAAAEAAAVELEAIRPAKRLRRLTDIDIDFSIDQAEGKMVLVCFWDMNQRPSRNCIQKLSEMAEELKARDVLIAAVHTSQLDENMLNEFVKKNKILFPVGAIEGDANKVRLAWGVESLPWLILTDKGHIVTAEGFTLDQLEKGIAQANGTK